MRLFDYICFVLLLNIVKCINKYLLGFFANRYKHTYICIVYHESHLKNNNNTSLNTLYIKMHFCQYTLFSRELLSS